MPDFSAQQQNNLAFGAHLCNVLASDEAIMSIVKYFEIGVAVTLIALVVAAWLAGVYLLFCCGAAIEAPEHIKCIVMNRC